MSPSIPPALTTRRGLLTTLGLGTAGLLVTTPAHAAGTALYPQLGSGTSRTGDRGWHITRLQWALNKFRGADPGLLWGRAPLTGVYDRATDDAVRGLQRAFGLSTTGAAGWREKMILDALHRVMYTISPESYPTIYRVNTPGDTLTVRSMASWSATARQVLPHGTRIRGSRVYDSTWVRTQLGYVNGIHLTPLTTIEPAPAPQVQAPDLLQPVTTVPRRWPTGFTLSSIYHTGVRVKMVQQRVGTISGPFKHVYDSATQNAVRSFQSRVGLPTTGYTDYTTWLELGFSPAEWTADGWISQPRLPISATPSQRITTALAFAREQLGASYTWGGEGSYRYGFDCSGFIMQVLHTAGVDPMLHNGSYVFTRTAAALFNHPNIRKVPHSQRRAGDLVFYTNSYGKVIHIGMITSPSTVIHAGYTVKENADYAGMNMYGSSGSMLRHSMVGRVFSTD